MILQYKCLILTKKTPKSSDVFLLGISPKRKGCPDQFQAVTFSLSCLSTPVEAFSLIVHTIPGLRESLQPCSRAARKWRENEEMKRKWRENEEIERKWGENEEMERESFPLHFLILFPFPHSLLISSLSFHFLILCRFPHSLSISSFSFYSLILCFFPHSLSIFSFSLHFLSISSFSLHFIILSPFPLNFFIFSPFPLFLMCCSLLAASIYGLSRECRENLNIRCMRK